MHEPETARHGSDADRPGREEWLLLAALCVAVAVYWAPQFHSFLLPNNDFYSFERAAQSFARGELPASFKRMPILPGLMAALGAALDGPHPELRAALIWNQLFSLGSLVGLFLLAARTLGRGAILVPVLFAATTQFHAMGLQPLVEPSLGFFVVWAFVGLQRRAAWQYLAAFAAALSRYEAGVLIPILFAVNVWTLGAPFLRHAALGAAAASGVVAWTALGALAGAGAGGEGSYLSLMQGMGWQPAPSFAVRALMKEPFAGWYVHQALLLPVTAVVVAVPTLAGVLRGWREFRPETLAALGFLGLCTATIVVFGIDKARYAYALEWIVLFFFAAGLPWAAEEARRRLPSGWVGPAAVGAGVLAVACLALWLHRLWTQPTIFPAAFEGVFLAGLLALATLGLVRALGSPPASAGTAAVVLGGVVLLTPVLAGGLAGKQRALYKAHYANYASTLLAPWLERHLAPGEKVVLQPRSHIRHLSGLPSGQLVTYSAFEAEDAAGLAAAMRERGIRYAAFTYRAPVRDPASAHYFRVGKTALAQLFRSGEPVPGFEHRATLPLPDFLERPPVQVYELTPGPAD